MSKLAGGKALPAELLEQILAKTDGVPLFVEELTKAILESGELKDAGDHYEYAGTARTITIPATLRDSLMARLDRFAPVKEIAQIGAAIGREFSYELIAAVAPHTKTELDSALDQLTESGLAFRRGTPTRGAPTPSSTPWCRTRPTIRCSRAADRSCTPRSRACSKNTSRTTKDTEPELLAHHLTAAGQTEAAIPLLAARRAQLALKRLALKEAICAPEPRHGAHRHAAQVSGARCQRTGPAHPAWYGLDGAQRLDSA